MVRSAAVWSLGLLLSSAPVVLHLVNAEGLPPGAATEVVTEMAAGLEASSGRRVALDSTTVCEGHAACATEIGTRFDTDDVVLVELFGAVQTGRARVLLANRGGDAKRRVDLEFPRAERQTWPSIFSGLGHILFPGALDSTGPPAVTTDAGASSVGPVIAWSAIGLGAALAGVAIALRVNSDGIRDDVESRGLDDPMRDALISRSNTQGLTSNLLFGAGAVSVASGLVYLLTR